MSIKYFAIFGVTVAAALAWAPLPIQANAHGGGFKMHSGHFGKHFPHFRHGAEISISDGLTRRTEGFMPFHPMMTAL